MRRANSGGVPEPTSRSSTIDVVQQARALGATTGSQREPNPATPMLEGWCTATNQCASAGQTERRRRRQNDDGPVRSRAAVNGVQVCTRSQHLRPRQACDFARDAHRATAVRSCRCRFGLVTSDRPLRRYLRARPPRERPTRRSDRSCGMSPPALEGGRPFVAGLQPSRDVSVSCQIKPARA